MSDNNLSIDEIIKRAELIKAQAEQQLLAAQKSLDEMAQNAMEKVEVDSEAVREKVEQLSAEEEDIKEFPIEKKDKEIDKTKTIRLAFDKKEHTKAVPIIRHKIPSQVIDEDEDDEDMKIVPDSKDKTKIIVSDDEDIFDEPIIPMDKTRPVVIGTKNDISNPDQLQEVPTLIAREHLNNYLQGDNSEIEEDIGIQMKFDGFDDEVEEVPTIDEELAEKILLEQRKEKVNKFRIFGPEETDQELGDKDYEETDYRVEKDQQIILANLLRKKKILGIQMIITLVLFVFMLLMTVFKNTQYIPNFLSGNHTFFATNLVLVIITILTNYNIIVRGLKLKKGINSDFQNTILTLAVLGQTIAYTISDNLWIDNGVFLGSALAFAYLLSQLGKRQILVRIIDNFDFVISSDDNYCMENIANKLDVKVLSRGNLDDEDAIIKTSVKTDFPTNFMEISCKNEPSNDTVKILTPIMILASIILMVAIGLIDNWYTGINMGICALAASTPIAIGFLMNMLLSDMSAELDKYGARVCGFEGAQMMSNTDAMVLEAENLFGASGCDLHGIKVFNNTKVDDAIIYAAAVIIKTKSPLAHVFDDVIIGKQSILPKVDSVQYEEQMGTSAWIYQQKVLVGNRNLLINHGVNVPKESFERKYTRKNRKALYLAVNGKIMAMFVVSYSADPELKRELRKLEKTGITLIVRSSDPYINEESLANIFSLPRGYIRVMNGQAARVFEKYSDMEVERSPAYVVHTGTAKGYISAMRGALTVLSQRKLVSFLVTFGCVLGFFAIAVLSLIKGYSQITNTAIIGCWSIWNIFVMIISKLKHIGF